MNNASKWIGIGLVGWLTVVAGCGDERPSSPDAGRDVELEPVTPSSVSTAPRIVILGDSLSAGYGLDPEQAYPSLLQQKVAAAGFPHTVVNAGVSGDTTSVGIQRLRWHLRGGIDLLVLALGGNDGLRGIDAVTVEKNLRSMIQLMREEAPSATILLAGMESPPNMGGAYTSAFREVFPRVAADTGVHLLPFLLEGVAGDPSLNQADGIHPTPAGQRRIAENVWSKLRPLLEQERVGRSDGVGG